MENTPNCTKDLSASSDRDSRSLATFPTGPAALQPLQLTANLHPWTFLMFVSESLVHLYKHTRHWFTAAFQCEAPLSINKSSHALAPLDEDV